MEGKEEEHLEKIQELLEDEDKIVTPGSLSSLLLVPISQSKTLMTKFMEDVKWHGNKIYSTHILMGNLNEDKGLGVMLSNPNELSEKRKLFSFIISEQIYAIQKNPEFDINTLTYVDPLNKVVEKGNKLSGFVTGDNCIKVESKKTVEFKAAKNEPIPQNIQGAGTEKLKQENHSAKQNSGIKNLFDKIPSKSVKQDNVNDKPSENHTDSKKQNNGIKNLFAQMPSKPVKQEQVNDKPLEDNVVKQIKSVKQNEANKTPQKENKNMHVKVEESNSLKKNKDENKKKRQKKQKSEQPQKKRKRIIEQCDSNSDDMFGSDEEELEDDVVENSEEEVQEVEKLPVFPSRKYKVSKIITTTYEAGDYIETKNEVVQVSESEEEPVAEEEPVKVLKPKENQNKKDSPPQQTQKGNSKRKKKEIASSSKQATLMDFFRKK